MSKMYCFIQYIEIPTSEHEISQSLLSMESLQTFHSVSSNKLETKKLMINPNCAVQILLDYVCDEINIDKHGKYDFCNFETGEMVGIKTLKPWSYATDVLKPKQTYIIVFYEKDEFGQYSKLEPLMNRQSKQYSDTLLRIKRTISSSKQSSSATRKSKGRRASCSSKGSAPDSLSSSKEVRQKKRGSSFSTRSRKSTDSKD